MSRPQRAPGTGSIFSRRAKAGPIWCIGYQVAGKQVQERVGPDRREAERTLARRLKEVAGGAYEARETSGATTCGAWLARWLEGRRVRSAPMERSLARHHIQTRRWLTSARLDDLTPRDMARLVRELAAGPLAPKSVSLVWGVLRLALRDAVIAGAIPSSPCVLPRDLLPRVPRGKDRCYEPAEVAALMTSTAVDPSTRMMFAVLFYTGCRLGEACGLQWGDLVDARPLRCLTVERQWDGRPLKTAESAGEQARLVPVHPELERILAAWLPIWEAIMCRPPRPGDRILITPRARLGHRGWHQTSAHSAAKDACDAVGARYRALHATRHTTITWLRRGGARAEVVERITHNAAGTMLDRYTHLDWAPLCEAMNCLRYGASYGGTSDPAGKWPQCVGVEPGVSPRFGAFSAVSASCVPPGDPSNPRRKGQAGADYGARHTCGPLRWDLLAVRVRRVK
jgi:integrase